jgi:hypothetical protein
MDSMAIADSIPTTTAACDTGRCGSCRGVVFSITSAHLTDCTHACHEPAPIEDQELDDILAEDADRRLDDEFLGAWS